MALLVPSLVMQIQAGTFDPSKFRDVHFATFEKTEDADVPKGAISIDTQVQALMAAGKTTGKKRPLSAERKGFIGKVGASLGDATFGGRAPLYTQEVELVDGKTHTWIAATDEDAAGLTKTSGHTVDVAVRNLGSLAHGAVREHLYLLINFRTE